MSRSILMFCPQFRPVVGGAERQAEKLALALTGVGCRVTIVTPRLDPLSPDVEEVDGVRIERFSLKDLSRHIRIPGIGIINIPLILWQVMRAVLTRLDGHDLLHCHIASLQTVGAALAGRVRRVPVLCKAAMADRKSDLGELEKTGILGIFVARMARSLIPMWVATTRAVESALARAGVPPDRIACIPNGVDLADQRRRRESDSSSRRFLYLGRLSTNIDRDVPTLISAFDRLARDYASIELAVVGGGDLYDHTYAMVEKCAARSRIHLPGFDKPEKWLEWADCFVLPSRREGLSNALLEAMAHGLACIANDIPPNREVLADGRAGVLVPVGDAEQLLAAMRRLVVESNFFLAMGAEAQRRAHARYGIGAVAEQYLALYDALIKRRVP